jgi:predicted MPP superfamily phosphohydrolase
VEVRRDELAELLQALKEKRKVFAIAGEHFLRVESVEWRRETDADVFLVDQMHGDVITSPAGQSWYAVLILQGATVAAYSPDGYLTQLERWDDLVYVDE